MCILLYIHMYIYIYIYRYACIYIYIYMYTYIHILFVVSDPPFRIYLWGAAIPCESTSGVTAKVVLFDSADRICRQPNSNLAPRRLHHGHCGPLIRYEHIYVYIYIYMYICLHICIYVLYIYIYVYIYICIYIYIYTYTYNMM